MLLGKYNITIFAPLSRRLYRQKYFLTYRLENHGRVKSKEGFFYVNDESWLKTKTHDYLPRSHKSFEFCFFFSQRLIYFRLINFPGIKFFLSLLSTNIKLFACCFRTIVSAAVTSLRRIRYLCLTTALRHNVHWCQLLLKRINY